MFESIRCILTIGCAIFLESLKKKKTLHPLITYAVILLFSEFEELVNGRTNC